MPRWTSAAIWALAHWDITKAMAPIKTIRSLIQGKLAKTTGYVFLLRGGNIAFNFAIAVVLARLLGPDDYGQYSFILALISMLAIPAQFGLPAMLIREVSRARADRAMGRVRDISRWASRLSLTLSVPIAAGVIALSFLPVSFMPKEELLLLLAGSGLIILLPLRAIRSGLIRGLDKVVLGQIPGQIAQPLLTLAFITMLAFLTPITQLTGGLTPLTALIAYSLAVLAAWALSGLILLKLLGPLARSIGETYSIPHWKKTLVAFGLANAMVLIDQQIGILVLGITAPDSDAGLYKVAGQAATFTAMGYVASNMALGPGVAKAWREGRRDAVQSAVIRGSRLSAAIALPISLFFLIAGGVFLELLFGADYVSAWPAMCLLVIAQFINCAFGSSTTLLNMSGNETANTRSFAIAIAANIGLCVLLAPSYGAAGAATAAAISVILRNVLLWRAAHRLTGIETGFWGRLPAKGTPG